MLCQAFKVVFNLCLIDTYLAERLQVSISVLSSCSNKVLRLYVLINFPLLINIVNLLNYIYGILFTICSEPYSILLVVHLHDAFEEANLFVGL